MHSSLTKEDMLKKIDVMTVSDLKIRLPVAAPVNYNPAYYLRDAFVRMGHDAQVLTQGELYDHRPEDADLWLGIDSGGPLNIPDEFLSKSCMWYIDSRRNSDPAIRQPDDDMSAERIIRGGGIVFQAQVQDVHRLSGKLKEYLKKRTMLRVVYLPLAADPDVWSDEPEEEISWVTSFVGNCFDPERLGILEALQKRNLLYWPGIEKAIMQDGATVYRKSLGGLNIPSWWKTPECYDVNMRVFEILSCGIPLITNRLDALNSLGIIEGKHAFLYNSFDDIIHLINMLRQDTQRAKEMGEANRQLILNNHTYDHRAESILKYCRMVMEL